MTKKEVASPETYGLKWLNLMKCGSPKVGWGGLGSNTYSSSLLRGLGATLLTPLGLIVGRPGVMFVG